jgi:Ca2+-binding EF-hand superfamily protein
MVLKEILSIIGSKDEKKIEKNQTPEALELYDRLAEVQIDFENIMEVKKNSDIVTDLMFSWAIWSLLKMTTEDEIGVENINDLEYVKSTQTLLEMFNKVDE